MSLAEKSSTSGDHLSPLSGTRPSKRRLALLLAGLGLLGTGITALAMPWVESSPQWDWTIRTQDDLAGAEVNAGIVNLGDGSFYLDRSGGRQISVISPRLTGVAAGRPVVEVTVSRVNGIQSPPAPPTSLKVILFWQTGPKEPFRMAETQVEVAGDGSDALAMFVPPIDASTIHRIGVQVPNVDTIRISRIRMIDADVGQLGEFFVRELPGDEQFGGESVNFFKGNNLLGRSLNYYLLSLCAVTLGVILLGTRLLRRRLSLSAVAAATLIPWFAGDVLFSTQLVRRAQAEGALSGLDSDEAIRAVYGNDIATAAEWLQIIPVGSRVSVIAADGVAAAHRLAYLAAPHVVLVDQPHKADYIVLMGDRTSLIGESTLLLIETKEQLPIRVIERWNGGALVERVHH